MSTDIDWSISKDLTSIWDLVPDKSVDSFYWKKIASGVQHQSTVFQKSAMQFLLV